MSLVILAVVALFIIGSILRTIAKHITKHGFMVLIFWWLTGHYMNGKHRTDAGWFTKGEHVVNGNYQGNASPWAHRPRGHRAIVRTSLTAAVLAALYGWFAARFLTEAGLAAGTVAGVAAGQYTVRRKIRTASHKRNLTDPLIAALAGHFGQSCESLDGSVSILPDYARAGNSQEIGTIILPDNYNASPEERGAMEHLLTSRLGISVDYHWDTAKRPMALRLTKTPVPPSRVPLAKMLPVIRELPVDKVLLGVTGKGEETSWNMGSEDPHCLVSAKTRRGKTRMLLSIACQVLAQGGEHVTVIDPKRVGVDECLAGVPGVRIFNDPANVAEMWDGIIEFRNMMDARIEEYQKDRTIEFKRALLVIDEASQFASQSQAHWDGERTSKDRARPPIWQHVQAVLWQGAQFKCSVLFFGQRFDFRLLGESLDSFGTILLAGYNQRTIDRLIGPGTKVPASSKIRGRFTYYDGDDAKVIQAILGDDQELRDLALTATRKTETLHDVKENAK
jgi:hypothetical protein